MMREELRMKIPEEFEQVVRGIDPEHPSEWESGGCKRRDTTSVPAVTGCFSKNSGGRSSRGNASRREAW
jgi:hypothetical protein